MTVFVQVKAAKHDYKLKVVAADMQAIDVFYKRLVDGIDLSDVTSSFAMEQIKYTTALPL